MKELERLSEDDEFRTYYDAEEMQRKLVNSARLDGYDAGVIKGKEEGAKGRELSIAKAMLKENETIDKIAKYTGLSYEEIERLKKEEL